MYSSTALLTNTMFSGLTSLGGVDLAVCMILPDIFMGALMPSLQSGGIGTAVPRKNLVLFAAQWHDGQCQHCAHNAMHWRPVKFQRNSSKVSLGPKNSRFFPSFCKCNICLWLGPCLTDDVGSLGLSEGVLLATKEYRYKEHTIHCGQGSLPPVPLMVLVPPCFPASSSGQTSPLAPTCGQTRPKNGFDVAKTAS